MGSVPYLDHLRRDGDGFAAAVTRDLDAAVPACPGWTCRELALHLGVIWQWVRELVHDDARTRPPHPDPPALSGATDVRAWLEDGLGLLCAELAGADPRAPIWGWAGQGTGFWSRRMAHETAVHRWDAESATGPARPIDATLAVDGIDEFLHLVRVRRADRLPASGETIHLHCTDTDGEWLLTLHGPEFTVEHAHAKGDVAARGTASDLDLFCWSRTSPSDLEVFGDRALLERFQAAANW